MIPIKYQYEGDPVLLGYLMFGMEFKAKRGIGRVAVRAIRPDGKLELLDEDFFEEAICDLDGREVKDLDPCVYTENRLYCWACAEEWILKHNAQAV